MAFAQILDHLNSNNLLSNFQSAYRRGHSTETALLKVANDLLTAMDTGKVSLLSLLDLSSAFDTVDHDILLQRLQHTFGFEGTVLAWLRSYLSGRTQTVCINGKYSESQDICQGVPQGSVLGPILFCLYVQPVSSVINRHPVSLMQYADDTQLYSSFDVSNASSAVRNIETCINDVKAWMCANKLAMNDAKTEVILIGPKRVLDANRLPVSLQSDKTTITISQSVRNLGVDFDSALSLHQHALNTCRATYAELRRISSIRHLLSDDATKTLMCSFVLSRLDYCNSLYAGAPLHLVQELQRVQNVAARITLRAQKGDSISQLLGTLHWLPIEKRIKYKVSSLCYNSLNNSGPRYLSEVTQLHIPPRCLRSSKDTHILNVPFVTKKSCGQRSFSYQGPITWNALPLELRQKSSLSTFKKSLKTHLFRQ